MSEEIKIDDETLEELSVIFTWAQIVIDQQYHPQTTKDMQKQIESTAIKIGLFPNETKMASLMQQSFSPKENEKEVKLPAQILEFPFIGVNSETIKDDKDPDK